MSESNDIPERVNRLEDHMVEVRREVAAARVLAAGADRDVSKVESELRAHTKTLNALRETQLDQGREMRAGFVAMRGEISEMREGFAEVRSELSEMREGFTTVHLGMGQITAILTTELNKPDES